MKNLKLLVILLLAGCSDKINPDNGHQYYIDKNNYPLEVTYVAWDKCEDDYLYHFRNYSFGVHLKDSFSVGTKLKLSIK